MSPFDRLEWPLRRYWLDIAWWAFAIANLAAMALYRKFGFTIEGTCRAYAFHDGQYVDAYLMARLNPAFQAPTSQ